MLLKLMVPTLVDAAAVADAAKTKLHDVLLEAGVAVSKVPLLEHTVEVILPGTACPTTSNECPDCIARDCWTLNEPETKVLRERILRVLGSAFGGGRCGKAHDGAWVDPQGELVIEATTVCIGMASEEALATGLKSVLAEARQIGKELGQDAMAVVVDGVLAIVPPEMAIPSLTLYIILFDMYSEQSSPFDCLLDM